MTKHRRLINSCLVVIAVMVFAFAIWGPEVLAKYRDKSMLNRITIEQVEGESATYRYALNNNEKLFLLSKCLDNQILPESELSAKTRPVPANNVMYEGLGEDLNVGSYAFVVNHQGPSDGEISEKEIFEHCNAEIKVLKELGILHEDVKEVKAASYSAVLYSAIDVLEPRNNLSVWKVSLSTSHQNADKSDRILDLYMDADTGKIYEFYVRMQYDWADIEPEEMVKAWGDYLGLTGMEDYENKNPLAETTPYFEKYRFPGMKDENTVVTVGFYEGISEFFIKISK